LEFRSPEIREPKKECLQKEVGTQDLLHVVTSIWGGGGDRGRDTSVGFEVPAVVKKKRYHGTGGKGVEISVVLEAEENRRIIIPT